MAELKFTKQELRQQQIKLHQLQRYLPTLQLRKALLQSEVCNAKNQKDELRAKHHDAWKTLSSASSLLALNPNISLDHATALSSIEKEIENIAGVEVPFLKSCSFHPHIYDLYDTPPWIDAFVEELRAFKFLAIKISVSDDRLIILNRELRDVYIRVNLFEKVLIPRCLKNIKSIKIFLGDLELASISQAKIAKTKINERKLATLGGLL
jgi:V/A-type H+-transporting ATPase subunit D